jgi:hypothetical protein
MVADMDRVAGPVEVNAGDVRLAAQRLLDRLSALGAVDIIQFKCSMVFRV